MKQNRTTKVGMLTVQGEGEVKLRPDLATLEITVTTSNKNAKEAVDANAAKMSGVIASMKGLGIAAADLVTSGFAVVPIVDYDEKSPTFRQIIEHRVDATLRARVDVERTGEAIDLAIQAGATSVGDVRFGVRDETVHRAKALKNAVKAAKRDADAAAEALGYKVLDAETIEVIGTGAPVVIRSLVRERSATPVEPGTFTVSASVRVVFQVG